MNKDLFDSIEVPTEELDSARNKAIMKGIQEQQKKKKRKIRKIYKVLLPVAAAVTITFGLGFVSEPIAQAVSSIPIIGETIAGFYESYANKTGNDTALTEQERIDETSIIATDQGITVEIVGTYVENAQTFGIFFEASGEIDPEKVYGYDVYAEDGSIIQSGVGPDCGYNCYIFGHTSDQEQMAFETEYNVKSLDLELVDGVYVGNIEIEFEDRNYLETIDSIPLTFNYMCGKEGEWSFEIPVEVEDDPNTIVLNQTQSEHGFTIEYESIYLGRNTDTLFYSVTADTSFEGNEEVNPLKESLIHIEFEDSNGEEIEVSSIDNPDGLTGPSDESGLGTWNWSGEVTFSDPLPEDSESITVKIEVETETGDTIVLTPYVLSLSENNVTPPENQPVADECSAGEEYTVGEDINPGLYDVESTSDGMSFNGRQLNSGDKILGIELYDSSTMTIEGNGTIKLTPAKQEPLTANEAGEIIIEHSGDYIVGSQIEPGTYEMSYRLNDESKPLENQPFVQISEVSSSHIVASYMFGDEGKDSYTIELKEGQTLEVMKSLNFEPVSDVDIVLKKLE